MQRAVNSVKTQVERNIREGSSHRSEARVLHVITGMGRGGAEKVATQLAAGCGTSSAIAWLKGPNRWEEAGCSLDMRRVGMERLRDLPLAVLSLSRMIRELSPDIVHTHLIHANLVGRFAARLAGTKRSGAGPAVISTEHNLRLYSRTAARRLDRLDVITSRRNLRVVAISEAVRQRCLQSGYRSGTLGVIYNGVEVPSSFTVPAARSRPLLTMVGRIHEAKGPDIFAECLSLVPEADGLLVGEGDAGSAVFRRIKQSAGFSRLTWRNGGDPRAAMEEATVVVVPSREEGLGIVALEAMSLGRPVVAARVGGLCEVIRHGDCGLLADPESPNSFAEQIRALLCDSRLCDSVGQSGRRRVEEAFTLDRMIMLYNALYDETVNRIGAQASPAAT
jgi:glycosyltransferase involved in cell wall biosynthesis